MKKTTLILLCLVITSICSAQLNYTIPMDSTSTWRLSTTKIYKSGKDGLAQEKEFVDFIAYGAGETIINNLVYTKMLKTGKRRYIDANGVSTYTYFNGILYGHIRSDSTRTYWGSGTGERLLYDFSLQVGDHLPNTIISDTTTFVTSIDTIIINGKSLRRFYIKDTVNSNLVSRWYIEGIGHQHGIIAPMYGSSVEGYDFFCYAENGVAVLPPGSNCDLMVGIDNPAINNDVLSIYPNPSTGWIKIQYQSLNATKVRVQIANAFGQIIEQIPWQVQPGQNERTFNLNSLSPGLHVVLIRNGGRMVNRKFLIVR